MLRNTNRTLDVYKRQILCFFDFRYLPCCCGYNPYAFIAHTVQQRVKLPPLVFFALFYRPLFYIAFDKEYSRTHHIRVNFLETGIMLIIALCADWSF